MKKYPTVPSRLARLLAAAFLIALPAAPVARAAGLTEDFSYSNGGLTAVSGGAWQLWSAGAQDASVVGGAMRYQGNTDVIRTFPRVLKAVGETASISFTINVNIADTSEAFALNFLPASAPFGPAGTNYTNQFSLGFDYELRDSNNNPLPADGLASIDIATGTGSDTVITRIGAHMTENVTHLIRVDLARGATNTAYSLFLDGNLVHQGTFVLTDPRGMNAVELEQSGEATPSADAFANLDNLSVIALSAIPDPEIVVEQPVGTDFVSGDIQNFGSIVTGSSTSVPFSIRNTGPDDLTGLNITIDGADAADFKISTAPVAPVAKDGMTTFTVTFAPKINGPKTAALHIASNDADEANFDINLIGSAYVVPMPEIGIQQPAGTELQDGVAVKDFGSQPVGLAGAASTFIIRNSGDVALTGLALSKDGANAADFLITSAPPTSIAAGASAGFTVVFKPTGPGSRAAALHITSNDADENPFDIQLAGTATLVPEIVVNQPLGTNLASGAAVVNCGPGAVGVAGKGVVFSMWNSGSADLTGVRISLSGANASDFRVTGPAVSTLVPWKTAVFTVVFKPSAVGTRTATLEIASNDGDENPFIITLTGNASLPAPEIAVEQPIGSGLADGKTKKSFGTVKVGKMGTAKTFTIKNNGSAILTGLSIAKDGANKGDFIVTAPAKTSLAAGASTTFQIRFKPFAAGVRGAAIHIKSNDKDESPFDIKLTGAGK